MANLQESEEAGFGNIEHAGKVSEVGKDLGYEKMFAGSEALIVPLSESVIQRSSWEIMVITDRTKYGKIRQVKCLPKLYPYPQCRSYNWTGGKP